MARAQRIGVALAALSFLFLSPLVGRARAQFAFIGPIPYRSAADSPFNLNGLGTTFFIEDFEDDIPAPGLEPEVASWPLGPLRIGGNSVDADDGVLDGLDSGGYSSFAYSLEACVGSACTFRFHWNFDAMAFGRYPTAMGFVLTANSEATGKLRVYGLGNGGPEDATFDISGIVSAAFDATDDLFIGVVNPLGIFDFTFEQLRQPIPGATFGNARYDHLQYGIYVPEPTFIGHLAISSVLLLALRRRKRRTDCKDRAVTWFSRFQLRITEVGPCKSFAI
jgi:hypothetical protein